MSRKTMWGFVCVALMLGSASAAQAQEAVDVEALLGEYGPVYDIPDPDFATPVDGDFKVVFDLSTSGDEPDALNPAMVSPARFLRMHVAAGVPLDKIEMVVVVHGGAGKDMLGNAEYRERYGVDNPNTALMTALQKAGARFVICGQTAAHRDLGRDVLAPGVEIALSAMTAFMALQNEGYALLGF